MLTMTLTLATILSPKVTASEAGSEALFHSESPVWTCPHLPGGGCLTLVSQHRDLRVEEARAWPGHPGSSLSSHGLVRAGAPTVLMDP